MAATKKRAKSKLTSHLVYNRKTGKKKPRRRPITARTRAAAARQRGKRRSSVAVNKMKRTLKRVRATGRTTTGRKANFKKAKPGTIKPGSKQPGATKNPNKKKKTPQEKKASIRSLFKKHVIQNPGIRSAIGRFGIDTSLWKS